MVWSYIQGFPVTKRIWKPIIIFTTVYLSYVIYKKSLIYLFIYLLLKGPGYFVRLWIKGL